MKYYVQFQQMGHNGRPIDHPSEADVEITRDGFIPNVGDFVNILALKDPKVSPAYSGKVVSRLFTYFGPDTCGVNIVVEDAPNHNWGALIKE